ncbi:NAD-dependent epimerase/dehydratase family protein [Persicimonas caeni]|uniref:NAD-dependent epimerase/dehydratase family protein n=1 Tax=Persicimonas caeni TaxID=2292766 RepID=A0A4Y6PV69_PERCE|nr:NAD(P)H-binding protein [Persicimonas caeni]QDG52222.1 NAD-dependent epimerase/dehydratase family protein [Persicimonas caeni]QED33444.1 NAD-dependent epimerase/dehydratase family protein [Persicimonas caeni]
MQDDIKDPILLTGATGFIGKHLYPRLAELGVRVRNGTRRPEESRSEQPDREWVELDVERPETLEPAMEGCRSAVYLVHQMMGGEGYRNRERAAARAFRKAAERAGVERIVYLGGVEPDAVPSRHLGSRLETGIILRGGRVSTVELRASMVIGEGSASWQIVRDLAARLPVMLLPKWTRSRSQPIYIDDVVEAIVGALALDMQGSAWFDIPGPETLTVEQILHRTARLLGHDMAGYPVPLLSPRLSSYWLRFVTGCDMYLARELVEGLKTDLVAEDHSYWERIGHTDLVGFDEAAQRATQGLEPDSLFARTYEGLVQAISSPQASP